MGMLLKFLQRWQVVKRITWQSGWFHGMLQNVEMNKALVLLQKEVRAPFLCNKGVLQGQWKAVFQHIVDSGQDASQGTRPVFTQDCGIEAEEL
jgi:hypothetical protein